uniref:CCHC-type domain-containing protein n=1 Tax=Nothobranchius korthausae TaxID=1143690 RepID=A0A1A8HI63_9TELE
MRDAADDGRKALIILREHYAGKGKPRIISLYTKLTALQQKSGESVTDYLLRAEAAITALRTAGETLSDGLLIAMVLKGLPESFTLFRIHLTQSHDDMTFSEFKSKLGSYEETEKLCEETEQLCVATATEDNVMAARMNQWVKHPKPRYIQPSVNERSAERKVIICYNCGKRGHKVKVCYRRKWCSYCKTHSHVTELCRKKHRIM